MAWVLRLVETGIDGPARVIDVQDIRPLGSLGEIAKLGLTLAEAKQILGLCCNVWRWVAGYPRRGLRSPLGRRLETVRR
jgi:hypothetical protein